MVSARADGAAIELTFDWAVEANPAPKPRQFTVNVVNEDGTAGTVEVNSVSVDGKVLTLDLASALDGSQTVTVDYRYNNFDHTRLQRAGGGDAAPSFSGQAVDMSQVGLPTIDLRLEPAVDDEGEVRPRTVTASWDSVPGATSYTLDWQRDEQNSQAQSGASGNSRRRANVPAENRLTVSADRTSADITVPDDGEWTVELKARGDGDEIIARSAEKEIRQLLEQQEGTSEPTASLTFNPTSVAAGEYISVRLTANGFPSEVSFRTYRPDSAGDYRRTQELRIQYTEEQARILGIDIEDDPDGKKREIYHPFTMKDGLVPVENTGDGASSERVWTGRIRTDKTLGMRELEATARLVWTEDGTEQEQLVTAPFTLTKAISSDLTEDCPRWMDPGDSCTFSLTKSNYSGVVSIENNQATITQFLVDDFEVVEIDSPYSFSVPVTTSGDGKTTTFTASGTITIPADIPKGSYEVKIPAQYTRSDGVQGAAWSFWIEVAGELSAEISFEDSNNLDSGTFVTSVAPGSAVRITLKAQHKRRLSPVDDTFKAVGPSPDESTLGTATVEKFNALLIGGPRYWWAYLQVPETTTPGDYSVLTALEWQDANGDSMTRKIAGTLTVLEPADVPRVAMPANVEVTLDGNSASLSWDAVSHASEYAVEYRHKRVEHQHIASIALMNWQRVEGLTAASATISGLRCSNAFEFRVQARGDGTEREDAWGAMTLLEGSTSECPDIEDPPAPVITSAVADGEDGIIVTWDGLAQHHGLGAIRLEFREAGADSEWTRATLSLPDFSIDSDGTVTFAVRGLTCGTAYEFRAFQRGSYTNAGRYGTTWSEASNVVPANAPACQLGESSVEPPRSAAQGYRGQLAEVLVELSLRRPAQAGWQTSRRARSADGPTVQSSHTTSIVYVIDDSGSMDGDFPEVHTALEAVRDETMADTKVALIAFGTDSETIFGLKDHSTDATTGPWTEERIKSFAGKRGGTYYSQPLQDAKALLDADTATTTKKIIFLTDAQEPRPSVIQDIIDANNSNGASDVDIIVDTIGFGDHFKDSFNVIEDIASDTSGAHRAITKPSQGTTNTPAVAATAMSDILTGKVADNTATLFLVDHSFSVYRGNDAVLHPALTAAATKAGEGTGRQVGLAIFLGETTLFEDAETTPHFQKYQVVNPIGSPSLSMYDGSFALTGSTNIDHALQQAYSTITDSSVTATNKRVVLITDGISAGGVQDSTLDRYKNDSATTLDVVAWGQHAKRAELKGWADSASGTFSVAKAGPPMPTEFTYTPGENAVTLSWKDPSDSAITKYQLRALLSDGFGWTAWTDIPGSDASTTWFIISTASDSPFYVQLRAVRDDTPGVPSAILDVRSESHGIGLTATARQRADCPELERPRRLDHHQVPVHPALGGRGLGGLDGHIGQRGHHDLAHRHRVDQRHRVRHRGAGGEGHGLGWYERIWPSQRRYRHAQQLAPAKAQGGRQRLKAHKAAHMEQPEEAIAIRAVVSSFCRWRPLRTPAG